MSWLFVAGTVLTVVGTGASIAANEAQDSAVHNARNDERMRQEKLSKQRQKTFDNSLNESGVDTAQKDLNTGTGAREALYAQAGNAPQGATATPALQQSTTVSGGAPTQQSLQTSKEATNAWSKLVGGSEAKLGAYGDWTQNQQIKNNRAAQDLAINANKSRGSLSVNQFEIEHASHAGDNLRDWGTVASALGSIGMMGGAAGLAGTANSAIGTSAAQVGSATGEAAEAAGGAGATMAAPNAWASLGTGLMGGFRRRRY
jgi:hypothetical protein